MTDKAKLAALAAMIAAEIKGAPPRPKLTLVVNEDCSPVMCDKAIRASRIERIRWLGKSYGLRWLTNQHAFGRRVYRMSDAELECLLMDMERGRECVVEGIAFEDAGLVRPHAEHCA